MTFLVWIPVFRSFWSLAVDQRRSCLVGCADCELLVHPIPSILPCFLANFRAGIQNGSLLCLSPHGGLE